jgi:hypothetical protein
MKTILTVARARRRRLLAPATDRHQSTGGTDHLGLVEKSDGEEGRMRTDIANCTAPTFSELAQLADALWIEQRYAAAARIFLQAAEVARHDQRYVAESTARFFALKLQDEAAKAA